MVFSRSYIRRFLATRSLPAECLGAATPPCATHSTKASGWFDSHLFGINGAQLIRTSKVHSQSANAGTQSTAAARTNSSKVKEKLPPRHRIAVIDLEPRYFGASTGLHRRKLRSHSRYSLSVLHAILVGARKTFGPGSRRRPRHKVRTTTLPSASEGAIPGGRTTLIITEGEHELVGFEPNLSAKDTFLRKERRKTGSHGPSIGFIQFPKSDLEDFNEFLSYTGTWWTRRHRVRFVDNQGLIVYAEAKGRLIPSTGPEVPATENWK
jgi:hypothetical protein